jgi:hypothetical protein
MLKHLRGIGNCATISHYRSQSDSKHCSTGCTHVQCLLALISALDNSSTRLKAQHTAAINSVWMLFSINLIAVAETLYSVNSSALSALQRLTSVNTQTVVDVAPLHDGIGLIGYM